MKLFSKKTGFTIIEMLIVIFIVAIVSAVFVVNFRKGAESRKLQRSAQQVAQNLRKIQNMALSSTELANPYPTGQKEVSAGGYVAYFDKGVGINTYYIYADFNSTKSESAGERIETITLESGIYFNEIIYIKPGPSYQANNYTNIISKSPDAAIEFQPPVEPTYQVVITIAKTGVSCSQNCQRGISCSADPDCRAVKISEDTGQVNIIK